MSRRPKGVAAKFQFSTLQILSTKKAKVIWQVLTDFEINIGIYWFHQSLDHNKSQRGGDGI
ncbi:hypothetical protein [Thermoflavimicrobium dichotomicum]|uniref:Uncharacterized protein n=1 Tax=Thermoflavimicrobium dichotomicum TaxID=46223 RepID=A0A1I3V6H4_9BACL|nr:hypothetical protein [Thermoflavimicrobium dichotomicum]SFJ90895.1 hypothetical protein SAMN05421852_1361 [Thermoflavimicrobium dichotomicum]